MKLRLDKSEKCCCCNENDADKIDLKLYKLHKILYYSCPPCRLIMWGE